jgi:zinc transporter
MDDLIERPQPAGDGSLGPKSFGVVPGLVWAFHIYEDGTAEPIDIDRPVDLPRDGYLWLHLNLADARVVRWLDTSGIPAAPLALLRSRGTHQQLHAGSDCIYGVFSDLVRDIEKPTKEMAHLHFVMLEHLLISGRHRTLSAVETARQEVACGARRLTNVAELLELIVDHVADAVDGLANELTESLDAIEDQLLTERIGDERRKLTRLRQTCVQLHRQLSGLRTVFHRMDREGIDHLKPNLRVAAGKLAQRLDALDHDIVEMRDRARLMQEEVSAKMVEETNDHLHLLSILTMLFLPPTLVTGLFGMNTKGLPFTDNDNAFLWALLLLIGSSLAVYFVMKRAGILK